MTVRATMAIFTLRLSQKRLFVSRRSKLRHNYSNWRPRCTKRKEYFNHFIQSMYFWQHGPQKT